MNLYEFYSRAYDPATGSWLQQDRYRGGIARPNSLYRYQYVENSPVNYWDGYGFLSCKEGDMSPMSSEEYLVWRSTYCVKEDGNIPKIVNYEADIFTSIPNSISFIDEPEGRRSFGSLCASMVFEPYDWYLTGKDIKDGKISGWDLLALAPLISKGMTSKIDNGLDVLKGSDEVKRIDEIHPSTPIGGKGDSLISVIPGTNSPLVINGRNYSGHALDRMQEQGIMSSVVENTIEHGEYIDGKFIGTSAFYDSVNDITIITNSIDDTVITVHYGFIKQH